MEEAPAYKDKNLFFDYHGIVPFVNIKTIHLGLSYQLTPLYGNNAIFSNQCFKKNGTFALGPVYEYQIQHQSPKKKQEMMLKETSDYEQYWEESIYFCEFCFKYTNNEKDLSTHCTKCTYRHNQPGRLAYLADDYAIKKVSPKNHSIFLESLCLFTKFFLDNKSSFCNLGEFEFFIVYARELHGTSKAQNKPLGFFSKQIASSHFENLSSILIIPPYRNKGLGTLLIEFSYILSIHELEFSSKTHNSPELDGFSTGPESPLSPFGLILYLNYWQKVLVKEMMNYKQSKNSEPLLIQYLRKRTHFESSHIILTLKYMECIKIDSILKKKYIDWERVRQIYRDKKLQNYSPRLNKDDLLIYY